MKLPKSKTLIPTLITLLVCLTGALGLLFDVSESETKSIFGEVKSGSEASAVHSKRQTPESESILASKVDDLAKILAQDSDWQDRYPRGEISKSEWLDSTGPVFKNRSLLRTGSDRIPWVVWEDRFTEAVGGEIVQLSAVVYMADIFLIDANPDLVHPDAFDEFIQEFGLTVEKASELTDVVCVKLPSESLDTLDGTMNAFQARFPGASVEYEFLNFPSVEPDDWSSARMWGLDQINALDAWEFQTGPTDESVVVAVIDTGLQVSHPDIAENVYSNSRYVGNEWDFVDEDSDPNDVDGHGTHVAGIVGAVGNNGSGSVGVNWNVKILPLKVGDEEGLRTSAIIDALAYVSSLKRAGVNIVATNNSYGSGGYSSMTRSEISKHKDLGVLFVAAAGNDGINMDASSDSMEYPAGYDLDNIISVASSNQEDALNASSNYGSESVDISAPGSDIYSLYPTDSYEFLSGTSMASPMVAGAVALLAASDPTLSASQIKTRLMESADLVESQSGFTVSGRRLNLLAALDPDFSGHEIEISNVSDSIVLIPEVGMTAMFHVEAHGSANISVSISEGDSVEFAELANDGSYRFLATGEGQSVIRFESELGGILRSIEKTVIVGDASSVSTGLLHHFTFDSQGATEEDLAGGSDGTLVGVTKEYDDYGQSVRFDSFTDKMSFAGQFSEQVTIAALVRSDNLISSAHPRIVNMPFYYLYISSGEGSGVPDGNRQTLKFYSDFENYGVWNAPPRSIQEGQWYYVVGSFDSSSVENTPALYINGGAQVVRMQQAPSGSMLSTGTTSYVGNNAASERSFEGVIADVRIYNRELSSTEVSQLGAYLVQSKGANFLISGEDSVGLYEQTSFELRDFSYYPGDVVVEWYLADDSVGEVSETGEIQFYESGSQFVYAQVSDGVVTRVLRKQVEVELTAGYYEGETSGGGRVVVWVDDSLASGWVSIFDPETGFYRFEQSITIDEEGSFLSEEDSNGQISGSLSSELSGTVAFYGISFTGTFHNAPTDGSDFFTEYEGGVVGVLGDSLTLSVFSDESVVLLREGNYPDVITGVLDSSGGFVSSSSESETISIVFDSESTVVGTWGEHDLFLRQSGTAAVSSLMAGYFVGETSGSGLNGLYVEFVPPGADASEYLSGGELTFDENAQQDSTFELMLAADGSAERVSAGSWEERLDFLASFVSSEDSKISVKEVDEIRGQLLLADESYGVLMFEVTGEYPIEILSRALGFSFVSDGAEDPMVSIYRLQDGLAELLGANDDWQDGATVTSAGESVQGAYLNLLSGFDELSLDPLPSDSKESAFRVWLSPGRYLLRVELASGDPGSCLIEAFAL
ncbi:S8 family serine peptidase [Pelagicoccus albus]|uniref:S8 family serine peptidase n=1 Tax=Pelagicoccus albus TaxID=415222 RepID=A0A7X1EBG2_9BACT|nr:S8 family serine peptidase [Pelagicoccus albus]MBC2607777.1 S8 family serine peptidase [Pelagicoccus albus]